MENDKQSITICKEINGYKLVSLRLLHLWVKQVSNMTLYVQILIHLRGEPLIMDSTVFFS